MPRSPKRSYRGFLEIELGEGITNLLFREGDHYNEHCSKTAMQKKPTLKEQFQCFWNSIELEFFNWNIKDSNTISVQVRNTLNTIQKQSNSGVVINGPYRDTIFRKLSDGLEIVRGIRKFEVQEEEAEEEAEEEPRQKQEQEEGACTIS